LDPADGGRRVGEEFVVSLVENEERAGGKFFDEGGQLRVGDAGAGGIVGGGDEDEARLGGEACDESGEVVMEVAVGHLLQGDAEELGHEAVDGEGVGGGQHLAFARAGEGVVAELDDFVGAAAEDDVVAGEAVEFGDGVAQGEPAAVGIKVGVGEAVADGLEGAGGGAERVFVGGEFGDLGRVETVLAGDVGDGSAGLVRDEILDVGVGAGDHFSLSLGLGLSGMDKLGV